MSTKYWKGFEEKHETPEFIKTLNKEFSQEVSVEDFLANEDNLRESSTPRRDFLKFLGFSVAAATIAACEAPVNKAIPYVNKPIDVTPGEATWYASAYYDGNTFASIIVKTREGRPIYIKSNRDFGFTNGGGNAQVIASVLSLYNEARLQFAYKDGQGIATQVADDEIFNNLQAIKRNKGKVVFISQTIASPSTAKAIKLLEQSITNGSSETETEVSETEPAVSGATFEHIQIDAISYAGIREANKATFGKRIIPDYDFYKADTIVSFGADFMSTWLMASQYAGQYAKRRNPDEKMNKHYQFESNMSITGANADVRFMIKPSQEAGILAAIAKELGASTPGVSASDTVDSEDIKRIADDLKKGNGLVVSGSNNVAIQIIVNIINQKIGAYNTTINLNNPLNMFMSEDKKMMDFVNGLIKGQKPDAVFFYGVNPAYTLPNGEEFGAALANAKMTVSLSPFMDETAVNCQYVIPDHHALESWNDYQPKENEYALAQPTIRPLFDTVAAQESFLVWAGQAKRGGKDSSVFYDFIKSNWKEKGFGADNFEKFWNKTVHSSTYSIEAAKASASDLDASALSNYAKSLPQEGEWEVVLYQKIAIGDGSQAGNPWLQEMPDPITKVVWDNVITMNHETMEELGYDLYIDQENGAKMGRVTVGEVTYELPVFPSPGQAKGTIGIALGYGRGKGGLKIGKAAFQTKELGGYVNDENGHPKPIGQNAFRMTQIRETIEFTAVGSVENTGKYYPIATTQIHNTLQGRNSVVRETTLDTYLTLSVDAYNPEWMHHKITEDGSHEAVPLSDFNLWESHPIENVGHRWGMSIDLNSCFGCGACMIACQAENNIPVVGKDEVRRGREMHWLRIDRYYSSDEEATVGQLKDSKNWNRKKSGVAGSSPKVVFQPMMCQHCNHAPCETVCPVSATTHSNEGLNQMTYNRCIGTRYCANNCPYKVRRFNWFNYPSYKKFGEINPAQDELGRMVLNPDVTVRTRGVMEKCSMCVQRIQETKLVAKKERRKVYDGDFKTACADACPADAIIVGDWNDPESEIRKKSDHKRAYQALAEIGTRPNVWYQTKVRNEPNPILAQIQSKKEEYLHNKH
ncbi:MAG: TAT-variant-translocated molybdopterin oxidoreductase [Brumimicrobium sp.]